MSTGEAGPADPSVYLWLWREAFFGKTLGDRFIARWLILLLHSAAALVLVALYAVGVAFR